MGGAAGATLAKNMAITDLPQMVAGFHSLVGLAALTTSIASFLAHPDLTDSVHLTSTFLGTFIGAVTLTGECPKMMSSILVLSLNGPRTLEET